MNDPCPVKPRGLQRQVQCFRDVPDFHRRAELPGDDVAREVVEDGRQVEPAPTDDFQIGEVGLPKLIGRRLSLNSSAAFITMNAGLAIRSCAFIRR